MENTKKKVNVVIAEVGMEVEESIGGINGEGGKKRVKITQNFTFIYDFHEHFCVYPSSPLCVFIETLNISTI